MSIRNNPLLALAKSSTKYHLEIFTSLDALMDHVKILTEREIIQPHQTIAEVVTYINGLKILLPEDNWNIPLEDYSINDY